jgi:hypothetical protein
MSESYKFSGTVKVIKDTVDVTDKFKKRDIVICDNSQYPQDVTFQFVQDKCGILDNYKEGQDVEVSFNLRGREWADKKSGEIKYFNTIEGWRIELVSGDAKEMPKKEKAESSTDTEEDDELPF